MSYSQSVHGRASATCLNDLDSFASLRYLRSTLRAAMAWTSSAVMPSPDETMAPFESDRQTTVAPSSIALSAAY